MSGQETSTRPTRFIIYGAGAIGATMGAALHLAGEKVVLIARGTHLAAIQAAGLLFEHGDATTTLSIPAVASPSELDFSVGDAVILATKGQDSLAALEALAAAAPPSIPVVCAQNGVENERVALRRFANVHAMCVVCSASHLAPGSVVAHSRPTIGGFDLGRYPSGVDAFDEAVADVLTNAHCESVARDDTMAWKYTKLIRNLGNATDALFGRGGDVAGIVSAARTEADRCLAVAGIEPVDAATFEDRFARVFARPPTSIQPGAHGRQGSSTWQSLQRGASVESDYLNGEVVLLGRLHNVDTPVNALLQELVSEFARTKRAPGTLTEDEFAERLALVKRAAT